MTNILFYTKHFSKKPIGGREKLSNLILNCLKNIFGKEFYFFNLDQKKTNINLIKIFYYSFIDGINSNNLKMLVQKEIENYSKEVKSKDETTPDTDKVVNNDTNNTNHVIFSIVSMVYLIRNDLKVFIGCLSSSLNLGQM